MMKLHANNRLCGSGHHMQAAAGFAEKVEGTNQGIFTLLPLLVAHLAEVHRGRHCSVFADLRHTVRPHQKVNM